MKGFFFADGTGGRLYPATRPISKQLLPIYDKPMIKYPLSILMLSMIQKALIISTERDIPSFQQLLGNGHEVGLSVSYAVQEALNGLAEAFFIGEEFISGDSVALVLCDNAFYSAGFIAVLSKACNKVEGEGIAFIFGYHAYNPSSFGVVEIDRDGKAISLEEKPAESKSNWAIPEQFFYNNDVVNITQTITPSVCGELEITSVNEKYLKRGNLSVEKLSLGAVWLDTGTRDSMLEAAYFVSIIQKRQGIYVSCIEEIAYRKGFISKDQLVALAEQWSNNTQYCRHLLHLASKGV